MSTRFSSKHALTLNDQTPIKRPHYKRKVSFSNSLAEEEVEDEAEIPFKTPTKRQKISSPSSEASISSNNFYGNTQTDDAHITPSAPTSQASFDPQDTTPFDGNDHDVSMASQLLASRMASATLTTPNVSEPSTPRRPRNTVQPSSGSAVYRSGGKTPAQISAMEQQVPRGRYRPVFSDHKQWCQRDPRVEIQNRRAEDLARSMMEKLGRALSTM